MKNWEPLFWAAAITIFVFSTVVAIHVLYRNSLFAAL